MENHTLQLLSSYVNSSFSRAFGKVDVVKHCAEFTGWHLQVFFCELRKVYRTSLGYYFRMKKVLPISIYIFIHSLKINFIQNSARGYFPSFSTRFRKL